MNPRLIRRPDWKEMRRFRALELKNEGCIHEEIAEALGMTKNEEAKSRIDSAFYESMILLGDIIEIFAWA
jgi:hypothetical protein